MSAFRTWCDALVEQSITRQDDQMLSVKDYIPFRRVTSGIRMVEGWCF